MWTDRQILLLTAIVTGIVTMLTLITTADWAVTALTIPLVASAAFWSLHISRRIGRALQRRYDRGRAAPPAEGEQTAPVHTSERPEHAQRRRQRRRPRGRRDS
ncbi:MAG: hypothetical protein AB7I38_01585 [Dehalococcoidia bacterium]